MRNCSGYNARSRSWSNSIIGSLVFFGFHSSDSIVAKCFSDHVRWSRINRLVFSKLENF
jgi:hypothetical protein